MVKFLTITFNTLNVILLVFIITFFITRNNALNINKNYLSQYNVVIDKLKQLKIQYGDIKKISISTMLKLDKEKTKTELPIFKIDKRKTYISPEVGYHGNDIFKELLTIKQEDEINLFRYPELNQKNLISLTLKPNSKILVSEKEYHGWYKVKLYNQVFFIEKKYIIKK